MEVFAKEEIKEHVGWEKHLVSVFDIVVEDKWIDIADDKSVMVS